MPQAAPEKVQQTALEEGEHEDKAMQQVGLEKMQRATLEKEEHVEKDGAAGNTREERVRGQIDAAGRTREAETGSTREGRACGQAGAAGGTRGLEAGDTRERRAREKKLVQQAAPERVGQEAL